MSHDQNQCRWGRGHNPDGSHKWSMRTRKSGKRAPRSMFIRAARLHLIAAWDRMNAWSPRGRTVIITHWEAYEGTERRTSTRGTEADRRTQ